MRIEVGVDIDTVDKHLSHDRPQHGAHPYTCLSGALEGGQFKEMAMLHVSVAYISKFQMSYLKKECNIFPNFRCQM